jgi:hypothetical protein
MDLETLKTTDCVSKPCVVRSDAPVFGEEPVLPEMKNRNILVEMSGIEPLASCLQGRRSPS